ncbi:MAG: type IV pilus modification PilV family protein [Candidatus Binatia bacterium]
MAPRLLRWPVVGTAFRREAGTSLVEIVVALVIFTVIILGLGNSVVSSRQTGASSRALAEATTLALDKLEHLRTLLLIDAQVAAGAHADATSFHPDGTTGGPYTRTWTITQDLPVVGMKRVEMRVSWMDRGVPASITLVTYLTLV